MPLGKYYCDYCDKEFQDRPGARKNHLQSLHHRRARAQWYHSVNDPNHSLAEPGVCNRFVKTGFCQYGDNCKYFHPKSNSQNEQPQPAQSAVNGMRSAEGSSYGNLPPSLMPPPEGGYPPLPFVDWG